jgi:hypothetical protein
MAMGSAVTIARHFSSIACVGVTDLIGARVGIIPFGGYDDETPYEFVGKSVLELTLILRRFSQTGIIWSFWVTLSEREETGFVTELRELVTKNVRPSTPEAVVACPFAGYIAGRTTRRR